MSTERLFEAVSEQASMFTECKQDYDPLIDAVGERRFVLLGESTHGTHEFYSARAAISARLIEEKGFTALAVEADWPDAYRVNRYIRGLGQESTTVESMEDFKRFPLWLWRNSDMLNFMGYLRDYNRSLSIDKTVGFYGLDLYNMYSSIDSVISYLERVDKKAAERARSRYECFERFGREDDAFGVLSSFSEESCVEEAVAQLQELRNLGLQNVQRGGFSEREEQFYTEQNARLIRDAEEYYRGMFEDRTVSWNLRERHMADTLDHLSEHLSRFTEGKVILWAHNRHVGDARATESTEHGELSLGQLVRERHRENCFVVGFTTYRGTVSAAGGWGAPVERKNLRPALNSSIESVFHHSGISSFFLDLREFRDSGLSKPTLERSVGVVYTPDKDSKLNYFKVRLPEQFDAMIHIDTTRALEPLEPGWFGKTGEIPQTYESGL